MKIYKKKWFWIVTVIVLILGGSVYAKISGNNKGPEYEFVNTEIGTLIQTVDATGIVQSADQLDLHFENGGTVDYIGVKEGEEVKAGKLLANLRLADFNASVAQAQANLNQQLAGSTGEEIKYYESAVELAKADWQKSIADRNASISSYESAVKTAENNLKLVEDTDNNQIEQNSYEDAISLLSASLPVLSDALTQADNILGIDNIFANDDFEDVLSITNSSKLNTANSKYADAKNSKNDVSYISTLNNLSPQNEIDTALIQIEETFLKMKTLLSAVSEVLDATLPIGDLTQTALNTKKSTVEASRTTVSTQHTSVINQKQAITDAKNSYFTFQIAYDKAVQDLKDIKATTEGTVNIKKASYDQAQANLDKIEADPREVDVAYYRAALSQAYATRAKAMIYAPIDGVITKINKKKGELAMSSEIMIEMLSPHFEIEVDIPETDIIKLAMGDIVEITLDAFGEDEKFPGKVVSIDPASTNIQDVVYYKVKVALENGKEYVRSGMTANVLISTESKENVLFLPFRAVLSRNGSGERYVRILENKAMPTGRQELKEVDVKIGLRGDNGLIEILEGLEENQEVVLKVIE